MKRGTTITFEIDKFGHRFFHFEKTKGKFTINEIKDILRWDFHRVFNGTYILFLKCTSDDFCGEQAEEQYGDAVDLFRLEDMQDCLICGQLFPTFEYCPHCGGSLKKLKGGDKNGY